MSIEEKIKNLWHDSDAAPSASVAQLDKADQELGFKLPPELWMLLERRDGGAPIFDLFDDILVAPFRSVAARGRAGNLVELYMRGGDENLPPNAVIFASDADSWLALRYDDRRDDPCVIHWSEYEHAPILIASSFREFLERLKNQ